MNETNHCQKDATISEARTSERCMETANHTRVHDGCFVDYVVSILGLKESTARIYDKYVWKAYDELKDKPEQIVRSNESMREAIMRLFERGMPEKTVANIVSGLKAYFKYKNGCAYNDGGRDEHDTAWTAPDIPYELMEQQNALELQLQEREDAFWGRLFEVSLLILTIVPTLVAGREQSRDVFLWINGALFFGGVGIVAMFYVLRRSSRQLKDLVDYGKRICTGEKINMEFHPRDKTLCERFCMVLAFLSLGVSFIFLFVSIIGMGG